VQFSYDYNPVWVSFRPTFWLTFLAVIGCGFVFFYRRRKPDEKDALTSRAEKTASTKSSVSVASKVSQQVKASESVTSQRLSSDDIKEFTDAYEEKQQLTTELKSLDSRAQKGKIPRRQYKVQRKRMENRAETLTNTINRLKDVFTNSGAAYADLARQLDSAEEDLVDAEENIKSLETRQRTGQISLETYKEDIGDYQKQKEKAESTINGILLRLREKTR
jgi:chromosome segregation ATPase